MVGCLVLQRSQGASASSLGVPIAVCTFPIEFVKSSSCCFLRFFKHESVPHGFDGDFVIIHFKIFSDNFPGKASLCTGCSMAQARRAGRLEGWKGGPQAHSLTCLLIFHPTGSSSASAECGSAVEVGALTPRALLGLDHELPCGVGTQLRGGLGLPQGRRGEQHLSPRGARKGKGTACESEARLWPVRFFVFRTALEP